MLTIPDPEIRPSGFGDYLPEDEADQLINRELARMALSHMQDKYPNFQHTVLNVMRANGA